VDSYDLLLLDTSPDIMNPVTRWAQACGTQLVVSTEQGFMTGSVVQHALGYLLSHPAAGAGEKTIAVINKVLNDARAGSADETERALRSANAAMPVVRIPYDLDLRARSTPATTTSVWSSSARRGSPSRRWPSRSASGSSDEAR